MLSILPRAVVFDLDGTLVDTAPDLANAMNWVLQSEGVAPLPIDTVRPLVGRGARILLSRGFTASSVTLTDTELDRLLPRFLTYYGDHVAEQSTIFPGVVTALEALAAADVRLAVCTNKPIGLAESLLDALGLTRHFQIMLGGDSLDVRKPDPRHLLETVSRLGLAPADSIMVGDSETDIKAARGAAVPIVGVNFGYTETPIHELAPDHIIGHFDELIPALKTLGRKPAATL